MAKRKEELKRCPFCGSNTITVYCISKSAYMCQCEGCYASARSSVQRQMAIKNWNRRIGSGKM